MGNCCSIPSSAENIIENSVIRGWDYIVGQANYVWKLEETLGAFSGALDELVAQRNDVQQKVDLAEQQLLKPLFQVQLWLSNAETMIIKAKKLLEDGPQEINKLCLFGCISKNCLSSYKFGKKVTKMLEEIKDHKSKGDFEKVAVDQPAPSVEVRPTELPIGLESTLDKVWSCIVEKNVGIIGLYGLGGVGKTTLLTQINNKFSTTPIGFDIVIWVVVSKDHYVEKVQDKIGEQIGFSSESWKNKSADQKAANIFGVLRNKKFVLLLDDLWERVDLTKVGIPIPSQENGSKLIFTTRFLEVCGEMEAGKKIKVECLEPEKAWKLFEEKVGDETLNSHPDIRKLAEEVVQRCDGLPLALITIGRAMTCKKTPDEWKYAIEMLKRSALPKMEKEVFPLLKFSYDSLPVTMRCCLLYCCLYPEDFNIPKKSLVEYWFCEGLLNEFDRISEAQMQGYSILNSLLSACLLESAGENFVKMHDVIRQMALWIASELEVKEKKFFVKAGVQLIEEPEVEAWEGVRRMSVMQNQIEVLSGTPTCPNLQTLFLKDNNLKVIRDGFFKFIPQLRVLDLSGNYGIKELPEGISELIALECLNLSRTSIIELPIKMKSLAKLKILDLSWINNFRRIPLHLISSFSKLQIFRMYELLWTIRDYTEEDNVLNGGNEGLIEELKCLLHLNMLNTTVKSAFALERFLSFHRFQGCTEELQLIDFRESKVLNVLSLANMERLESLYFFSCESMEEMKMEKIEKTLLPINSTRFHTLSMVEIWDCDKLRDTTWLILAPNLRVLSVGSCEKMEEILSEGKLGEVADVVGVPYSKPFPKLQNLTLQYLPELKSIYWDALPFPCLKNIVVFGCFKLKKLPFNSDSAKGNHISIIGPREWCEKVEWEDDATRDAFLPSFKPLGRS